MKVVIRQIEEKDISGFHHALEPVAAEGRYLLTTPPVSFENIEKFIMNNIAKNHSQYIAEVKGEIVGWADIIPSERKTMKHVGSLGMGVLCQF